MTQNARKRCWHCNIWPDWFTSHQSHYCIYCNGISEFMRKRLMLKIRAYKKWQTSAISLKIWRPGDTAQNLDVSRILACSRLSDSKEDSRKCRARENGGFSIPRARLSRSLEQATRTSWGVDSPAYLAALIVSLYSPTHWSPTLFKLTQIEMSAEQYKEKNCNRESHVDEFVSFVKMCVNKVRDIKNTKRYNSHMV